MEVGTTKTVENKGLKFELKALDEYALVYNEKLDKHEKRQLGEVVSDVNENEYNVKKGIKMLIAK